MPKLKLLNFNEDFLRINFFFFFPNYNDGGILE